MENGKIRNFLAPGFHHDLSLLCKPYGMATGLQLKGSCSMEGRVAAAVGGELAVAIAAAAWKRRSHC